MNYGIASWKKQCYDHYQKLNLVLLIRRKEIDKYKSEYKEYWSAIFDKVGEDVEFTVEEGDTIEAPVEYADV